MSYGADRPAVSQRDAVSKALPAAAGLFHSVQRSIRLREALRALEASVALLLCLWVGVVLADWFLQFAPAARAGVLGVVVVAVATSFLVRMGGAAAHRIGPLYLAARIERRYPAFANRLIAAVELAASGGSDTGADALIFRQAEELARKVDAREVVAGEPGRAPVHRALIASMGIVLAGILIMGGAFFTHSARVAFPWLDVSTGDPAFLAIRPKGARLVEEEPFDVTAVLGGEGPREVVIEMVFADGSTRNVRMSRSLIGLSWTARTKNIPSSGRYRLRARYGVDRTDLLSSSYDLRVVKRPRLESLSIEYAYPKYTRLEPRTTSEGRVDALVGTRVTVTIRPSCGLVGSALKLAGEPPKTMRKSRTGDDEAWSATFEVERSGSYTIEMSAPEDAQATTREFAVVARSDREPRCDAVTDEKHAAEALATGVTFHINASDDVGLKELVLVVKRLVDDVGASETARTGGVFYVPIPGFTRGARVVNEHVTVPPQVMRLEAGVDYVYYVRAADGSAPEPHLASSGRRTFRIARRDPDNGLLAKRRRKKRRPPLLEPKDEEQDESLGPGGGGGGGGSPPPPSSRDLASLDDGNAGSSEGGQGDGESSPGGQGSRYAQGPGLGDENKEKQQGDRPKDGSSQSGSGGQGKDQSKGKGQSKGQSKRQGQGKGQGKDGGKPQLPGQGEPRTPGGSKTASRSGGGQRQGGRPGGGQNGGQGGGQGNGQGGGAGGGSKRRENAPDASGRGPGGGGAPNAGKQEKRERDGGMPTGGERGSGQPMPETVDDTAVAGLDVKRDELDGVRVPDSRRDRSSARGTAGGHDIGTGVDRRVGPMAGVDRVTIARDDLPRGHVMAARSVGRAYRPLVSEYFRRLRELAE